MERLHVRESGSWQVDHHVSNHLFKMLPSNIYFSYKLYILFNLFTNNSNIPKFTPSVWNYSFHKIDPVYLIQITFGPQNRNHKNSLLLKCRPPKIHWWLHKFLAETRTPPLFNCNFNRISSLRLKNDFLCKYETWNIIYIPNKCNQSIEFIICYQSARSLTKNFAFSHKSA